MSHKFSNKQAWRNTSFLLSQAVALISNAKPQPEQYDFAQEYAVDLDTWNRTFDQVSGASVLVDTIADDVAAGMDPTVALADALQTLSEANEDASLLGDDAASTSDPETIVDTGGMVDPTVTVMNDRATVSIQSDAPDALTIAEDAADKAKANAETADAIAEDEALEEAAIF